MANITMAEIIAKAKERTEKIKAEMSDANALKFMNIFPEWAAGNQYIKGQRIRYKGMLYRVMVGHTADENREPGADTTHYELTTTKGGAE